MTKVAIYYPPGYRGMLPEERDRIVNGCGPAGAKFDFIPDNIWGMKIGTACDIHDYMYFVAPASLEEKRKADEAFRQNLLVLIEAYSSNRFMLWLRRKTAQGYYQAVKNFGGPAFWKGKRKIHEALRR